MEITGEVTDIIYQNEVNSYTVAEFETEEGDITIVGYLPFVNVGDTLKLIGKIDWSWLYVTMPLWIPIAFNLFVFVVVLIVALIKARRE